MAANVPNGEGHALDRGHGLNVKPNGWNGTHVFVQFDLQGKKE